MHRSKIEWCDDAWNPITGCLYECEYCYARKISRRFSGDIRRNMNSPRYQKGEILQVLDDPFVADTGGVLNYPYGFTPTYHRYRLNYPQMRKNGCNILVGEAGELFGDWVPESVLREIFESCKERSIHNYLFLTRKPERYGELRSGGILPEDKNFWYGSTVACSKDVSPCEAGGMDGINTFICIEPIAEAIRFPAGVKIADWIIIGAETGNRRGKIYPEKRWIDEIVKYADRVGIPVFMNDSLKELMGDDMRTEIPKLLTMKEISPLEQARRSGVCFMCKKPGLKKDMIALAARTKRRGTAKQLCYVCKPCFMEFCSKYNIEIPELEGLKDEKAKLSQNK